MATLSKKTGIIMTLYMKRNHWSASLPFAYYNDSLLRLTSLSGKIFHRGTTTERSCKMEEEMSVQIKTCLEGILLHLTVNQQSQQCRKDRVPIRNILRRQQPQVAPGRVV